MTTCAQPETDVDLVPVLWMDNDPKNVVVLKRLIEEERKHFGITVEIAPTIEEARRRLESGVYGALVVDCKMDDYDPTVNGAEFLREVAERNPALPRFVYSAYLEDPRYESLIEQSRVIASASKVDEHFVPPLAAQEFFRKLNSSAIRFFEVRDVFPEQIEFRGYEANPDSYSKEVSLHWKKHEKWITSEMKERGWVWCVVVGTKLVAGSSDLDEYPTDESLIAIGKRFNLVPFAYGGVPSPEESRVPRVRSEWSSTKYPKDWYPTLEVRINGEVLREDLDTGSYCTYVSDKLVSKGWLNFTRNDAEHLGKRYDYFVRSVPVEIVDAAGVSVARSLPVAVVEDWGGSAFVEINPQRRCLLGRDLLRAFDMVLVLDSGRRETVMRHSSQEVGGCPLEVSVQGKRSCSIVS